MGELKGMVWYFSPRQPIRITRGLFKDPCLDPTQDRLISWPREGPVHLVLKSSAGESNMQW